MTYQIDVCHASWWHSWWGDRENLWRNLVTARHCIRVQSLQINLGAQSGNFPHPGDHSGHTLVISHWGTSQSRKVNNYIHSGRTTPSNLIKPFLPTVYVLLLFFGDKYFALEQIFPHWSTCGSSLGKENWRRYTSSTRGALSLANQDSETQGIVTMDADCIYQFIVTTAQMCFHIPILWCAQCSTVLVLGECQEPVSNKEIVSH